MSKQQGKTIKLTVSDDMTEKISLQLSTELKSKSKLSCSQIVYGTVDILERISKSTKTIEEKQSSTILKDQRIAELEETINQLKEDNKKIQNLIHGLTESSLQAAEKNRCMRNQMDNELQTTKLENMHLKNVINDQSKQITTQCRTIRDLRENLNEVELKLTERGIKRTRNGIDEITIKKICNN